MTLIPQDLAAALTANGLIARRHAAEGWSFDPAPLVKLFSPVGAATWIASELYDDGDTLFGLADLGFGCPELGTFSLREIAAVRLPFGLFIERDTGFAPLAPLSLWTDTAQALGSIIRAEAQLRRAARNPFPFAPSGESG